MVSLPLARDEISEPSGSLRERASAILGRGRGFLKSELARLRGPDKTRSERISISLASGCRRLADGSHRRKLNMQPPRSYNLASTRLELWPQSGAATPSGWGHGDGCARGRQTRRVASPRGVARKRNTVYAATRTHAMRWAQAARLVKKATNKKGELTN